MEKELILFEKAFYARMGKTPKEYIENKLKTESEIDAISYLFNIISHDISLKNNCESFGFEKFYAQTANKQKHNC